MNTSIISRFYVMPVIDKLKGFSKVSGLLLIVLYSACSSKGDNSDSVIGRFNVEKDLLLAHYDCKTDVDDLHSAAALKTLITDTRFGKMKYHVVAGTYGIQEGLYVPANELFITAFNDNWSDAHTQFEKALNQVTNMVIGTLENGGDIWIADAGQSNFSASVVRNIRLKLTDINTSERIHIVQHSTWNEQVTSPEDLEYVKINTDYHKIPDGNAVGNGTPGFRSDEAVNWREHITNPELVNTWNLAITIGKQFNGKEDRYNNEAIAAGGLDFSDMTETCWILGLDHIKDAHQFFEEFSDSSSWQ